MNPAEASDARIAVLEAQVSNLNEQEHRILTVMDGVTKVVVPRAEIDARFAALGEKIDKGFESVERQFDRAAADRTSKMRQRVTTALAVAALFIGIPGAAFAGAVPLYHLFHPAQTEVVSNPQSRAASSQCRVSQSTTVRCPAP